MKYLSSKYLFPIFVVAWLCVRPWPYGNTVQTIADVVTFLAVLLTIYNIAQKRKR